MSEVELKTIDNLDFKFSSPIEVTAKTDKRAIIKGTLLQEGISRNGNLYTIREMEKIADHIVDVPIQIGLEYAIQDSKLRSRHKRSFDTGKIIRAWLDKAKRKIFFVAEVWGDAVKNIKKGWGVSIHGIARKARYVVMETGNIVTEIRDLLLQKVQIFKGGTTGIASAKVESVEVQECMTFGSQSLSPKMLRIIIAGLQAAGEI